MAGTTNANEYSQLGYSGVSPFVFPSLTPNTRTSLIEKYYKKVGKLATETDHKVKNILHHEITLHQPEILKNTVKNIVHSPIPLDTIFYRDKMDALRQTISRSNEVLASAKTVFPLTLFRDEIVVDRTKITITKKNFFFLSEVMSIRIEDILNVKVTIGPMFGSLTLVVRVMSTEDHHSINYFWRDDAINLKHIIQGYIIAQHNQIDIGHQTREELIKTLQELGHDTR